jgi:sugar lactone lactonase YvrE
VGRYRIFKISKDVVICSLLVLMIVSGYVFASELANTPWPKIGGDMKNTGVSHYAGSNEGVQKWAYNTGGAIYSTAVIGTNGEIIFGSQSGKLYALNSDGTEKWIYDTGLPIWSGAAIGSDGTIYAIAGNADSASGVLLALDGSGNLKWKLDIGTKMYGGSIAIDKKGNLYFGTASGKVIAVNAKGEKVWEKEMNGAFRWSVPAIGDDGTIYVTVYGPDSATMAKVAALTPDGKLKWDFILEHRVSIGPTIGYDGNIYAADMKGGVHCITPDGDRAWTIFSEPLHSSVAITKDGSIYIGGRTSIKAFLPQGKIKWGCFLDDITIGAPVVDSKGNVYIATLGGKVHAFTSDGMPLWEFTAKKDFNASLTIGSDGTIYIGSLDGYMYAIK